MTNPQPLLDKHVHLRSPPSESTKHSTGMTVWAVAAASPRSTASALGGPGFALDQTPRQGDQSMREARLQKPAER